MRWFLWAVAVQSLCGQAEPAMPAWLANYPGVEAQTNAAKSIVEITYVAPAKPADVAGHYRKLFQEQNLPFAPSFDGMGTVVRAAATECDLMISIRAQGLGTAVRVDCTARTSSGDSWTAVGGSGGSRGPRLPNLSPKQSATWDQMMAHHAEIAKEIHKSYPPQPAPPLAWPEWLTHVNGRALAPQRSVDQSHHDILKCRYVTNTPMTAIRTFYQDVLEANGYKVSSAHLETGHTMSGVQQNADGHVEGANYPMGSPGPRTEIRVDFSRSYLNDPISVNVKFTTYAFEGYYPLGQKQ